MEQVDGKNIDGSLTLAENIADNGGIKISYEAFLQLMQSKGTPANDAGSRISCAPASCLVAAALAVILSPSCSLCDALCVMLRVCADVKPWPSLASLLALLCRPRA